MSPAFRHRSTFTLGILYTQCKIRRFSSSFHAAVLWINFAVSAWEAQIFLICLLLPAGDQVGHLWWRVQNGEVPIRRHPKAVVILIGTNDLTADDCLTDEEASVIAAQGVVSRSVLLANLFSSHDEMVLPGKTASLCLARSSISIPGRCGQKLIQKCSCHRMCSLTIFFCCRVTAVLSEFRARLPNTDVILLGILPRDAHVLSGPPAYEWPNRMTQAISSANQKLQVSPD